MGMTYDFQQLWGKSSHLLEIIRHFKPVYRIGPFVVIGPVCRTDPVCESYICIRLKGGVSAEIPVDI